MAPRLPHLVTQRGNRGQEVFFGKKDYAAYCELLAEGCRSARTKLLAYCLMPTHVHLILVPSNPDGLRAALGEAHRRYTRAVNLREGWRGYLWQGRFASFPMDKSYLLDCVRYVEQTPVREGLVRRVRDWKWSSARAHLAGEDDDLIDVEPLLSLEPDWKAFLRQSLYEDEFEAIEAAGRTGRPLGPDKFTRRLEKRLNRQLVRQKPGPKPRQDDE
ncbi:transposase [Pelagibius sp. Alg239-R121]|uniref:transposase n=1 Tax=Pelagibius sp. Alg239-R121 TaxID=2993448 RepID=UPI0024A784B9|nr:transposase [Pelagibius sp. Alg239-R121]